MTGSRDIEGMFVFTVGRVVNAWLVLGAVFAFKLANPHLAENIYNWWDGAELFSMVNDL